MTLAKSRAPAFLLSIVAVVLATPCAQADLAVSNHAPDIANLSGHYGNHISTPRELSRGKAAIALTITSRNDIACGIAIEGRKLGANANFETQRLDRCSSGKGSRDDDTVDANSGEHISGLRVCTSRSEPVRVDGLEIEARATGKDGLSSRSGGTTNTHGSHCDRWGSWSTCPEAYVVTGFVAHFKKKDRGNDLPDALVGLQAVCREVLIR